MRTIIGADDVLIPAVITSMEPPSCRVCKCTLLSDNGHPLEECLENIIKRLEYLEDNMEV